MGWGEVGGVVGGDVKRGEGGGGVNGVWGLEISPREWGVAWRWVVRGLLAFAWRCGVLVIFGVPSAEFIRDGKKKKS